MGFLVFFGTCGDGGPATDATLSILCLAIDGAGNIYISNNARIRKIVINNRPPHFVNGRMQYLNICENSGADSVNAVLAIRDSDRFQTEVWSVITPPAHGILNGAYRSGSNGSVITPTGLYYMPTPGFSGGDSFSVIISDAIATDTTTVHITVNPLPGAITGVTHTCPGATTTLSDAVSGGTWSSSNTTVATMSGGAVSGVAPGTSAITYTPGTGCSNATVVTVNPLPPVITGVTTICPGSGALLSDGTTGGTWSSGNTSAATAGLAGFVTGVAPGTSMIAYTLGTGCLRSTTVTVNPLSAPITGTMTACPGTTTTLSDATSGGTWSSSNTAAASVGSGGAGVVMGVAPGTSSISYSITATGCAAAVVVTVNPLPPAITGTLPAAGLCIGATASLADGTSGGVWSPATGGIAEAGTATGIITGVAAGTALVTYTLPTGCIATRMVSVNPYHVPAAIAGSASVCTGATAALTDGTTGGAWSSSATAMASVSAGTGAARVTGIAPGTAVITYTMSTGCAAAKTITVNPAPALFMVTGGGGYCAGAGGVPVGLSGSAVGVSYQLYYGVTHVGAPLTGTGGALSFGLQTLDEVYTVIANDTVTGCLVTMADSAAVVTNPLPAVYPVTGGGHYCIFDSGVHIGLGGSATGVSYRLYRAGVSAGLVTGTGTPVDFGLITTTGVYIIVAANATTGCADTMADSATVTIDPEVTPSVSVATGIGDTVCSGAMLTITATITGGGATPAFAWTVNGLPVAVSGGAYTYLPSDGDRVAVTLTSSLACAAPDTASSSLTLSVLATGLPAVHITAAPGDSVCDGGAVHFTAAATFGGPAAALTWVVNGSIAGSGAGYSYIPANHDIIYCILGSDYQCRTADSETSNHITMTVADSTSPVVTVTVVPGTDIYTGQSVALTATATHADATATYQWYVNGAAVTGANSPTFTDSTITNGDSLSCEVTGNSICNIYGYGWAVFDVSEGMASPGSPGGRVTVWPNPGNGTFTITGALGTTDEEVSIEITDLPGQVIYRNSTNAPNGLINTQVSLNSAPANGVYILRLSSSETVYTYRVVVVR